MTTESVVTHAPMSYEEFLQVTLASCPEELGVDRLRALIEKHDSAFRAYWLESMKPEYGIVGRTDHNNLSMEFTKVSIALVRKSPEFHAFMMDISSTLFKIMYTDDPETLDNYVFEGVSYSEFLEFVGVFEEKLMA
jgi:hypothetical protein